MISLLRKFKSLMALPLYRWLHQIILSYYFGKHNTYNSISDFPLAYVSATSNMFIPLSKAVFTIAWVNNYSRIVKRPDIKLTLALSSLAVCPIVNPKRSSRSFPARFEIVNYTHPPRENTGIRSPLDPNRRKGTFLGSNSTGDWDIARHQKWEFGTTSSWEDFRPNQGVANRLKQGW